MARDFICFASVDLRRFVGDLGYVGIALEHDTTLLRTFLGSLVLV
jgi:hypothetical protein